MIKVRHQGEGGVVVFIHSVIPAFAWMTKKRLR